MDTVFAVAAGEYSDYHVLAIFATKKQAQTYVDQYEAKWYDRPFVEEFAFIPKGAEVKRRLYYRVRLKDGVVDQRDTITELTPQISGAYRYSRGTWSFGYSTRSYAVAEKAARDALTKIELEEAGL